MRIAQRNPMHRRKPRDTPIRRPLWLLFSIGRRGIGVRVQVHNVAFLCACASEITDSARSTDPAKFGLIPYKHIPEHIEKFDTMNTRSETIGEKRSFSGA